MENSEIINMLTNATTEFLTEFSKDSAYYINRFLCGYNKDKLRQTLMRFGVSFEEADKEAMETKSYHPITREFVHNLYLFYETMERQVPTEEDMVVYRGCDTLEDGALDGIIATSKDKSVAENFNYGTFLKINIPKGSRVVDATEFIQDAEKQIILPPCDYTIKGETQENLFYGPARVVEVDIKPRDILRDFSIAMQNPTGDYARENGINSEYKAALSYLTQIIIRKSLNDSTKRLLKIANDYDGSGEQYFNENVKKEPIGENIIVEFLLDSLDKKNELNKNRIQSEFGYVSPEEQETLFGMTKEIKRLKNREGYGD